MLRSLVLATLITLPCLFTACAAPSAAEIERAPIGPRPEMEAAKACAKQLIGAQLYDAATAVYTWPEQIVRGSYAEPNSSAKFGWQLSVRAKGTTLAPPHTHDHQYVVFFRNNAAVAVGAPSYDGYDKYSGTIFTELKPPVQLGVPTNSSGR